MNTYQITLVGGFDSRTSETDHLIRWINAPSEAALMRFIERNGVGIERGVDLIDPPVTSRAGGVDYFVDEEGNLIV